MTWVFRHGKVKVFLLSFLNCENILSAALLPNFKFLSCTIHNDGPPVNRYHFRENLYIFEHLLDSDIYSYCCEDVNLFLIMVSFYHNSSILNHTDTSETERLREVYHATVSTNPKL